MSDLIVEVCEVARIDPHPNADRLEIATIKGWEMIVGKGQHKPGEKIVYVPIDSVLPDWLADKLNVAQYLRKGRVRPVKLRGVISYGLAFWDDDLSDLTVGTDVAERYGITKWEPPPIPEKLRGKVSNEHPMFHRYTDIQNYRNFPDSMIYGEEVVVTEKIHGTNARYAVISMEQGERLFVCGSHRTQRGEDSDCIYRRMFDDRIRNLLTDVANACEQSGVHPYSIILFGEIYGSGVQDLDYGCKDAEFRAFDISINGTYADWHNFQSLCATFDIPMVPVVYIGPFSHKVLSMITNGPTTLRGDHMREGVVVKPTTRRTHLGLGRAIVKSISGEYLLRKGGTENH